MRVHYAIVFVLAVNVAPSVAQHSRVEDKILTQEFASADGKSAYIQNGQEDYVLHCSDEGRFHLIVKGSQRLDRSADSGRLFVGDASAEFNCIQKERFLSCLGDFPMRVSLAKLDSWGIGTFIIGNTTRQISGWHFKDALNRMRPACSR